MSEKAALSIFGPLELTPTVQHYDWGNRKDCSVRRLAGAAAGDPPYAELWIGAHPKSPALAAAPQGDCRLDQLIAQHPDQILGPQVFAAYGGVLPYLLKVLSINEPLSIQAHPHAELAARLHARDPENYPDPNPKPEMALALTEVKLLYGFLPGEEITENLARYKPLRTLVTEEISLEFTRRHTDRQGLSAVLRKLYANLLRTPQPAVQEQSQALFAALRRECRSEADFRVLALQDSYPGGDVGLFSFYLMNILTLRPDDAVFLAPNTPHSYLCGEMVECMRNSDATVRAGLTSKFKDTAALTEMLSYETAAPGLIKAQTRVFENGSKVVTYPTPAAEFLLSQYAGRMEDFLLPAGDGPLLLFCTEGSARLDAGADRFPMLPGCAILIPAVTCAQNRLTLNDPQSRIFSVEVPA